MNCVDCNKIINPKSTRCVPCRNRMISSKNSGINNVNWKGEKATYKQKHTYMNRKYGKAFLCENNKEHIGFFEWANMSGKYLRDRTDWKMLCHSCNIKMDNRKRNKKGQWI